MSVPRPAMFVAIVTAPRWPAWATISASRSWCLALSTTCGMPRLSSSLERCSELSIEAVPTSTGRPFPCSASISSTTASHFSRIVRKMTSGYSLRRSGLLVGISMTSRP